MARPWDRLHLLSIGLLPGSGPRNVYSRGVTVPHLHGANIAAETHFEFAIRLDLPDMAPEFRMEGDPVIVATLALTTLIR